MSQYLADSELMLSNINDTDFTIHSITIFDKHMKLAIQMATDIFYNLNCADIIEIEKIDKKSFFGKLFSLKNYDVRLGKNKVDISNCGIMEKLILQQFEQHSLFTLNELIGRTFQVVFRGKGTDNTNPGKEFLVYILQNQVFELFSYENYKKLFVQKVKIWQTVDQVNKQKEIQYKTVNILTQNPELRKLIEDKITNEFDKYKPTGTPLSD